jgi:hypothetical protein
MSAHYQPQHNLIFLAFVSRYPFSVQAAPGLRSAAMCSKPVRACACTCSCACWCCWNQRAHAHVRLGVRCAGSSSVDKFHNDQCVMCTRWAILACVQLALMSKQDHQALSLPRNTSRVLGPALEHRNHALRAVGRACSLKSALPR